MRKNLVATATQKKKTVSSGTVASGVVQKRKRRTLDQVRNEGYDCAIRHCVEALLDDGNDRGYISWVFLCNEILFPSTNSPDWEGLFACDDWLEWAAIDEA